MGPDGTKRWVEAQSVRLEPRSSNSFGEASRVRVREEKQISVGEGDSQTVRQSRHPPRSSQEAARRGGDSGTPKGYRDERCRPSSRRQQVIERKRERMWEVGESETRRREGSF